MIICELGDYPSSFILCSESKSPGQRKHLEHRGRRTALICTNSYLECRSEVKCYLSFLLSLHSLLHVTVYLLLSTLFLHIPPSLPPRVGMGSSRVRFQVAGVKTVTLRLCKAYCASNHQRESAKTAAGTHRSSTRKR